MRTNDPAQTYPWLIYFTILSLTLLFESWTVFIIGWFPFYSWIRLFFLLYLVLPQTQGAKVLYLTYLEPYIVSHEARIDHFISEAHERLQQMGLGYLTVVVEFIRDKVLGQQSPQTPQAPATKYASYAQDLLSRFAMPSARTSTPAPSVATSTAVYSMVSNLAGAAFYASSRSAATEAASIPDSLVSNIPGATSSEKSSFISAQRDRLASLMKALDTEQQNLDLAYGTGPGPRPSSLGGLRTKSKSEQSFENVEYDDAAHTPGSSSYGSTPPKHAPGSGRTASGGWIPAGITGLFGGGADTPGAEDNNPGRAPKGWSAARDITEEMTKGISSGFERER